MLIGACRIEHLGKAQKRVKAGKKAVTSGPSALLKVFSKEDQHDDGGAKKKEGEGEARKEGPSQDPELAKRDGGQAGEERRTEEGNAPPDPQAEKGRTGMEAGGSGKGNT